MREVAVLFAEIGAKQGHQGVGCGYARRAGGPGRYARPGLGLTLGEQAAKGTVDQAVVGSPA
ncbi:hypothetical protein ACFSKW_33025 [Nonomuraea mangrovi]|uniref:Uncharacterized protein n=1 Tax=Nonomuraea mangrovi TaxID=2316207 RepID=A0ABW4T3S9_9ACTN